MTIVASVRGPEAGKLRIHDKADLLTPKRSTQRKRLWRSHRNRSLGA